MCECVFSLSFGVLHTTRSGIIYIYASIIVIVICAISRSAPRPGLGSHVLPKNRFCAAYFSSVNI